MSVIMSSVVARWWRWRRLIILRRTIIGYRRGIYLHRWRAITYYWSATVISLVKPLMVTPVVATVVAIPALCNCGMATNNHKHGN
ncbi:hypothetical protein [Flavipsychrobacter stenotrophus]|uniref:hypothetical protein n=1 Tax=Flavipsychrobacter stenotrophus TaxID=2077091 RepID=UPI00137518C5|nr:hypothetical protein [Flavipsychrobacter stenotrophus]